MVVAMVVAVRQALDYTSTGRAIGVCVIGFVVYLLFGVAISLVVGMFGARSERSLRAATAGSTNKLDLKPPASNSEENPPQRIWDPV